MRCAEVREELVAYLDGELTDEMRDCIDSHLASCQTCRTECAALDSTGDLLSLIGGETKSSTDIAGNVLKISREGDPWCRHIQKELTAFIDGELSPAEERPVVEHLADCEDCRAARAELELTGDALTRWTFTFPEVDLVSRVLPHYRPRRRIFRMGSLAAAACLLLAVGIAALSGAFQTTDITPPPDQGDLLDAETRALLADPELIEIARDLEWIESFDDEELALLNGSGG
jgi:predicted anti-sigma-YlaC factor YlaD